jgi:FtsP/CotA-like multicopper oxidase with cupredoxin domain
MYHTHTNDLSQLGSGLYGPIIVLPPGQTFHADTDRVFLISRTGMRKDGELLLNGSNRLQSQHWNAGLLYRLRFININGNNTVVVTLSQNGSPVSWKSLAKDGADLPAEQAVTGPASFLIAPGETYDFQLRREHEADMQLTFFLALFKETLTQPIRVDTGPAQ